MIVDVLLTYKAGCMDKYYTLEIGYNGADITDIATTVDVDVSKVRWLVELIQSGYKEQEVLSGFVNVVGKETFSSFSRRKPMTRDARLPNPKSQEEVEA